MKLHHHAAPARTAGSRATTAYTSPTATGLEGSTPNSCGHERIPPQWRWHYRTLLHLRERLMRSYADHTPLAAMTADMLDSDVAETAHEKANRDRLWAELENEPDCLFEVDCALQRIHDGTYGFCEDTGHAIPAERLRAIPWTRYCLAAEQPIERGQSDAKKHPR